MMAAAAMLCLASSALQLAPTATPSKLLNTGAQMPALGFGTWRLEGDELRLQRLVWMCDANLSAVAEINAILTSTFAQVIMQPHALVLALGYNAPDTGSEGFQQ